MMRAPRGRLRRAALTTLLAVVTTACGAAPVARSDSPTATAVSPRPLASATPAPTAAPSCATRTLLAMTEDQRIGQLFLLGLDGNSLGDAERHEIRTDNVGSVWFTAVTGAGVAGIRTVADAVQAEASAPSTAGVRFFVAANQEGGRVQALTGPGFAVIPSALVQGSMAPDALQRSAGAWAASLSAAGVNLDFAPVADVVPAASASSNAPIGALNREYGDNAATVGTHVAAFIAAMTAHSVATTLKHFPGLGRVTGNTDFTAATDPTASSPDASFGQGIAAGAGFVMVALAHYPRIDPNHLAAFSALVISGLLRGSLGFNGVVMSDDLGATAAVAAVPYGARALSFLTAGGDLIVSKTAVATAAMVAAVRATAATDPAFRARLDGSVTRILAAKASAGLLPC